MSIEVEQTHAATGSDFALDDLAKYARRIAGALTTRITGGDQLRHSRRFDEAADYVGVRLGNSPTLGGPVEIECTTRGPPHVAAVPASPQAAQQSTR